MENEQKDSYPVITVMQGRPSSPYFKIVQPVPGEIEFNVGQEIHCINPKTRKMIIGTVTKCTWTFPWDEAPEGDILANYGVAPQLLRMALIAADKEYEKPWVRMILIKEN